MAYYLKRTDGTPLVTLQDRTMNSAIVPLTLIGRGVVNYGTAVSENFVRLLENFAASRAPDTPISGQLWYNSTNGTLNLYSGLVWTRLASADYVDGKVAGASSIPHPITFAGDLTGSGQTHGTVSVSLAASGATPGTYTKAVVDTKGRITQGLNITAEDIRNALGYVPSAVPTSATAVTSVNSKAGDVVLRVADIPGAAPLNAPSFTSAPHFTPVTSTIGGRFYVEGTSGQHHAIIDNYQSKLRIFRPDGNFVLSYDLTNGALYVPGGVSTGGAVTATGAIAAGAHLLARTAVYSRSVSGGARHFVFQNDAGDDSGAIIQYPNNGNVAITANGSGAGWSNSAILDRAGNFTASRDLYANNAVYSFNGFVASRSDGDKRFVFERANGAATGLIWQASDNSIRITPSANGSGTLQVNPDGSVVVARDVYAQGGNFIVRGNSNTHLIFQNAAGNANKGLVAWNNSSGRIVISANGDGSRPVSVTNLGDIFAPGWAYAQGFCFDEYGAKDTGFFSAGDGLWVCRNNGVPRLVSGYNDFTVLFSPNNAAQWAFQTDGNVVYSQNGTARWAVWNYTSDRDLKTNIQPWGGDALRLIDDLRVVTFDWKDASSDPTNATDQIGFIAQEVEEIVPAAVKSMNGTKLLNKAELVPHLTKAVQELSAENRDLRDRVERLEKMLNSIMPPLR